MCIADDPDCSVAVACSQCENSFPSQSLLDKHMELCIGKTIPCIVCHEKFSREYALVHHQNLHSQQCGICAKKIKYMNAHLQKVHFLPKHDLKISKTTSDKTHIMTDIKYCCKKSGESFGTRNATKQHFSHCKSISESVPTQPPSINSTNMVEVSENDVIFRTIHPSDDVNLMSHSDNTAHQVKYKCYVCEESFEEKHILKEHAACHANRHPRCPLKSMLAIYQQEDSLIAVSYDSIDIKQNG